MLTIEDIRERLKDSNLIKVSAASGLHFNTVYRVISKENNPSYFTHKALNDYLVARDQEGGEPKGA